MVGSMTGLEENTLPFARIPRFPNKPAHPATRCFHPKHLPGEGSDSLLGNAALSLGQSGIWPRSCCWDLPRSPASPELARLSVGTKDIL